jgi:hypothetical protein
MILKNNRVITVLFYFLIIGLFSGCAYSFTGTSLSPDIKSISISTFPNNSGQGPSFLTQVVTNEFRNYYQRNTNLDVLSRNGELQIDGQIINFSVTPVAAQIQNGQELGARNRLTITVQVKFTNTHDPKQNFDQAFSNFRDLPQNQNISQVDEATIRNIVELMLTEIFNKTVANW